MEEEFDCRRRRGEDDDEEEEDEGKEGGEMELGEKDPAKTTLEVSPALLQFFS